MSKSRKIIALVFNLLIVLLETIGLTMCFYYNGWHSFDYYTIDSNIIAFFASLAYSIVTVVDLIYERDKNHKIINVFKYLSATSLFITATVVVTILGPMAGGYKAMLLDGPMPYVHVLCPLLTIISYMFIEKQTLRGYKVALVPTAYSFIYGVILIVLNVEKKIVGPYPFFEIYKNNIWFCVGSCLVIIVVAYLFSVFVNILNKKNS